MKWTTTGEVRVPREGEWFSSADGFKPAQHRHSGIVASGARLILIECDPSTIEVPASEIEALRKARDGLREIREMTGATFYMRASPAMDDLIARLPAPDHVATLLNLRNRVETRPSNQVQIPADIAALDAAIEALKGKP